jgi:hypothetical protein
MFVLVFGIKNYLSNKEISLTLKISHLLITFLIFQYYFIDFRNMLWELLQHNESVFYSKENFAKNTNHFDFITSILYFLNCAFVSGLTLNIAMKARSRKLLLFSSPIIVIITSLDLYKYILTNYKLEVGGISVLLIIFFLVSLIFVSANLYYNFPPGRKVFVQ